jgi:CheY-like chemotaxis protein
MPGRVLIVDDYPKAAEVLGRWLQRSGREIRTACDGIQAFETAEQFLPDVMLVDIKLPRLDGYEVAERIRQQPWGKHTVLIALTGWISDEDRARAREAGFTAVLLKPFDRAELSAMIAECFRPGRAGRG